MSVTATVFGKYKLAVLAGTAPALDSATLMVGLVTDDWEPDVDADEFWGDIDEFEVAAGGEYVTDGQVLGSAAVAYYGAGDFAYLDALDVTWAASTITAHYAVLYAVVTTPADSPLIAYVDFGADQVTTGTDFVITWAAPAAGGIVKAA